MSEQLLAWTKLLGNMDFNTGIVNIFAEPKISEKFRSSINSVNDYSNNAG